MENCSDFSSPISLLEVKEIRRKFEEEKDSLSKGVLSGDEEKNEIVLELHFLMNDLNEFFDEFLDPTKVEREVRLFSGEMPTIVEGASEKEISSSTLNNEAGLSSRASNSHTERRKPKTSIDNLHEFTPSRVHTVTPQKHLEHEQLRFKYQESTNTIKNLRTECTALQKTVLKYKSDISQLCKRGEQLQIEKKYCLDLLVKHTTKNEKLENQNQLMKESLSRFEGKCKELSEEVVEKSELLDEIKEFLKTDEEGSDRSDRVGDSELDERNEKLSVEIMNINRKLEELLEQNGFLSRRKGEMERDMEVLLSDNKEMYGVIQETQAELRMEKNKNNELIKIEESKRLNDMVHKQNKHLLQVNYELSNKVYELGKNYQKLRLEMPGSDLKQSHRKSPDATHITHDDTLNCPPLMKSKFSADKNNTGETFFEKSSIHYGQSEERFSYEENWRMEKERNKELEGKVNQLMEEMGAYEEELEKRRREIQNLNVSLSKRDNTSFNQSRANKEEEGEELRLVSQRTESRLSEDTYMSLKQFSQRFEPSLMDTLFIMLRVSELSELMVTKGKIFGVFPENIFLILDDPDRPQNIHVKIEKQKDLPRQQTFLFQSPEIVINEVYSPNEPSLVWNIGMIFYYLIYKQPYFSTLQQFIDQQNHVTLEKQRFPEAENIIEGMLERDPEMRISLKEVLEGIASEINKMFEEDE